MVGSALVFFNQLIKCQYSYKLKRFHIYYTDYMLVKNLQNVINTVSSLTTDVIHVDRWDIGPLG